MQRGFSSPLAFGVALIPPSLYAAEYTTKERNMLFIYTIGYISSGRATRRRPVRAVSLARDSNGFRITRQSEWTECIIACADIVRPAAQLCSWVSAFFPFLFLSLFFFFRFSSLSYVRARYLRYRIWTVDSRNRPRKDDLVCNKVRI